MDKDEIAKIKQAINLIHHKDQHYEGLNILARLVGWPEMIFPKKTISIFELWKDNA